MNPYQQTIYLKEIPSSTTGAFWVSFEDHPRMVKTRGDIYGRCLPCIQNLYNQLKSGKTRIRLGNAYHCWKITAVLDHLDLCFALLEKFSTHAVPGPIYGKLGSGRSDVSTRVLVFHSQDEAQRDQIRLALDQSLKELKIASKAEISRACAVLYHGLLGDWRTWQPTTPIRYHERISGQIGYLKRVLYQSAL